MFVIMIDCEYVISWLHTLTNISSRYMIVVHNKIPIVFVLLQHHKYIFIYHNNK